MLHFPPERNILYYPLSIVPRGFPSLSTLNYIYKNDKSSQFTLHLTAFMHPTFRASQSRPTPDRKPERPGKCGKHHPTIQLETHHDTSKYHANRLRDHRTFQW